MNSCDRFPFSGVVYHATFPMLIHYYPRAHFRPTFWRDLKIASRTAPSFGTRLSQNALQWLVDKAASSCAQNIPLSQQFDGIKKPSEVKAMRACETRRIN